MDANHQYRQDELPSDVFNVTNGDVRNFNGQAVKVSVNNNGTRSLQPLGDWNNYQAQQALQAQQNQAQADYKAATDTAIGGLQKRSTDLQGQYGDLLASVKGIYQPLVNQTTESAGAEEARRGISPDSFLNQQQVQGALQPVYGAEAGNQQQILQGSVSDMNTLASGIAGLQTGVAGTAAQLPLQYGSLSLQQQALPSQIALAAAQARQANTGANYITVPNLGVYDLAAKSFVGGGAGASPGALTGVGGLFKNIP